MNEEDKKPIWNSFDKAFIRINECFDRIDKISSYTSFSTTIPNVEVTKSTTIRLSGKRFKTFFNLLRCAFEILLTNKTKFKIKNKSNI